LVDASGLLQTLHHGGDFITDHSVSRETALNTGPIFTGGHTFQDAIAVINGFTYLYGLRTGVIHAGEEI